MKQAKHAHIFVLVQNERDKYSTAKRISHRLLVSLSPESRVCFRLKINYVYSECPYKLSYIDDLALIQMMRATASERTSIKITQQKCALSLSLPTVK